MKKDSHTFQYFIMFDAGTGGHFIATTMCKNLYDPSIEPVVNFVNEYNVDGLYQHCWTAFRQELLDTEFEPKMQLSHIWSHENLVASPYTYQNRYIIQGDRLSYLLVAIKKYFKNINDDAVHQTIENILVYLNDIDAIKKFIHLKKYEKYDLVFQRKVEVNRVLVPFLVDKFDLSDTKSFIPALYEYTAHTAIQDIPVTVNGFKKYVGNNLCDIIKEFVPNRHYRYDDWTIVPYKQLMIDKTVTIPGLDSTSIDQYMQKNFELIERVYSIIDDESIEYIKNFLNESL